MEPHYYAVFGLTLASDFLCDVLEPVDPVAGSDVVRVLRTTGLRPSRPPEIDPYFDIQPDKQYMNWNAVGAFCIDDPSTVRIDPQDGVSDHLVSQALLGLVMSLVLERRGVLCLHASAVSVQGHAALFLGDKGAGKSTTSAALVARGHVPITDDLVAVGRTLSEDETLTVQPGFSSMKLWPDSIEALGLGDEASDRLIHPSLPKVQKRMATPIAEAAVPLGSLFMLRRSDDVSAPQAVRLPPHKALETVLRYTFMARYGETRLGQNHLISHLKRCGAVVSQAPVFELLVPADLSRLDDLTQTIEQFVDPTF
ncbi:MULTISPECIES: hypothetical protein [Roseobacter]|uniref:hypothetical protein n=1 Tax=Roseobacter TaxID=2433 RepID=UPI001BB9C587|nr:MULTISPECIES: hypothetical protein [Roseobacter]GIT87813.1 hypothetical protein ROBYS_28290 [Roseobacter sp. OBYS 0001]